MALPQHQPPFPFPLPLPAQFTPLYTTTTRHAQKSEQNFLDTIHAIVTFFFTAAKCTHIRDVGEYAANWERYKEESQKLAKIAAYVDRHARIIVTEAITCEEDIIWKTNTTIDEIASEIWKKAVVEKVGKAIFQEAIQKIIEQYKQQGEQEFSANQGSIIAVQSLVDIDRYAKPFATYYGIWQRPYIEMWKAYLVPTQMQLWGDQPQHEQYMNAVHRILERVAKISSAYCHEFSLPSFAAICERIMIKQDIATDFIQMLEQDNTRGLWLTYDLLRRVPNGLSKISAIFGSYVVSKIVPKLRTCYLEEKGDMDYVQIINDSHATHLKLILSLFKSDEIFVKCLESSYTSLVSHHMKSYLDPAHMVARCCDEVMRASIGSTEDHDGRKRLSSLASILSFVEEKDVFQNKHIELLSLRLIDGPTISIDAELICLELLTNFCGTDYVHRCKRMLTDINNSENTTREFKASDTDYNLPLELLILTSGVWPIKQSGSDYKIPAELQTELDSFESFYKQQHDGRRISWCFDRFRVHLKCWLSDTLYEIVGSFAQISVLLCFEKVDTCHIDNLRQRTGIAVDVLRTIAASLVEAELLLPLSSDDDDRWRFNTRLQSQQPKLLLPNATAPSLIQEPPTKKIKIEQDRTMFLQATIVRLMKQAQRISDVPLITQVCDICSARFVPNVDTILDAIESLITKGYMERKEVSEVTSEYIYIA